MSDYVLFDELQLIFRVPKDLDDAACDAIRRILESRPFRSSPSRRPPSHASVQRPRPGPSPPLRLTDLNPSCTPGQAGSMGT
jgi:hypothetical protein